jgi:hypothetical protein
MLAGGGPRSGNPRELAPFYPLPPALGKREGMALLQGPGISGVICGGRAAVRAGAYEPLFRGA